MIYLFFLFKQQLERLGREIEELKYENRNLSNNVMDLIPDDGHDPRQHDRNNKGGEKSRSGSQPTFLFIKYHALCTAN